MKYFTALVSLLFFIEISRAQDLYRYGKDMDVTIGETQLSMPFAGGINSAQVQTMDVNGDGKAELVIWDINAGIVSVFQEKDEGYTFLPEMAYYFPADIIGFMVLADYDGDGKKDLFTGSPFGIKAYKNATPPGQAFPQWEVAQDFLRLENGSNLTANSLDIPLIMDLDGDGDLDILTFNFATGDYLEYYRNTSMERKGVRDIDAFASAQPRWGGFEFCGCGQISFGFTCAGLPISGPLPDWEPLRIQHAGGHSMLYHDFDGDGIKDLLIGQDECSTLYFLPNKGTDTSPSFDGFTTTLRGIGPLPEFPVFHAAYLYKDKLIITTHSSEPSSVGMSDFSKSMYLFSLGEGEEPLLTTSFLQSEMIDMGENARPFFEGNLINGNLVVTGNIPVDGKVIGKAHHYSLSDGKMKMESKDFMHLSDLGLRELSYQAYRSINGKKYHFVTGDELQGQFPTKKLLIKPEASDEWVTFQVPGFTLRGVDHLHFFNDSRADYLLLARQTGELVLFHARFDDGVELELLERDFLSFSDNPVSRGLSVTVYSGENPVLMAADQRGILFRFTDFLDHQTRTTIQISHNGETFSQSRLGRNTWLTFVPDIFGERLDVLMGTRAGGLQYLEHLPSNGSSPDEPLQIRVYPNPAQVSTKVVANRDVSMDLIHSSGQLIWENIPLRGGSETEIRLWGLAPGLYVLRCVDENQHTAYKKLIVKK
jgi:hypothetical protein